MKAKGINILVKSFQNLQASFKSKLFLVGKLEEPIKELKTKNKEIIITGWVNNVEDYLKKGSIFVNLTTHESFGISILKAMTVGNIPLITEDCGMKEIIAPLSKKLIWKRSVDNVTQKIKLINSNMKQKKILSQHCKKIASKFTRDKSVNVFKNKFIELMTEINRT